MARKFENITELYRRTQESVTGPCGVAELFVFCLPQLQAAV